MKAYLTKRQSLFVLRAETGLSKKLCAERLAKLPTKQDGSRDKISRTHLRNLINELNRPPERKIVHMRPLSERHLQISRATAETKRIITKLQERMN